MNKCSLVDRFPTPDPTPSPPIDTEPVANIPDVHLHIPNPPGPFASISTHLATRPSTSATQIGFPTAPDLIALFDEDLAKQTTSDLCAYTDFYPYNNILTQALLSCAVDTNQLCDPSGGHLSTGSLHDNANLAAINQTSIDNLKALTNLHHHSTNFLSGVTLPKPTSVGSDCSSEGEDEGHSSFIHNVQANTSGGHYSTMANQHQPSHHYIHLRQQQSPPHIPQHSGELQNLQQHQTMMATTQQQQQQQRLETDECMEVEDTTADEEIQYEEVAWDEFDPYLFIKHLPPLTPEMRAKCPALPLKTRSSPEFSLVLDLDETLVHCSLQELSDASFNFPVLFQV